MRSCPLVRRGVPEAPAQGERWGVAAGSSAGGSAGGTTPTFEDNFDGTQVDTTTWQVATWKEHGGQTGVDRVYVENGKLHLVFINDPGAS